MASTAFPSLSRAPGCAAQVYQCAWSEQPLLPRNDRDEEVTVGYRIADGAVQVDPWPFSVGSYAGYLVGYQLDGYPTVLEPVVMPYQLAGWS